MHGRLKVYTTAEQEALKKKEQEIQLAVYRKGFKKILESRKSDGYDIENMKMCGKILMRRPDIYTLWNYRKEAVLKYLSQVTDRDDLYEYFQSELQLTQQCLISNSKSYSSWHHRFWVLERHPKPDWQSELNLCGQYLSIDDRNFHCWDFRRLILNNVGVPLLNEISFCTDRININFSNYSSWHYRSTLKFLDAVTLPEELLLVQNAIYTDPYDSSAWFYLRWVLSDPNFTPELRDDVLKALNQLSELELSCRWVLIAKCWVLPDGEEKEACKKKLAKLDVLRIGRYVET